MANMRLLSLLSLMTVGLYAAEIKTVHFPSEDHKTQLVAYLFEPEGSGPHAAIVLLHGRAGPYSSLAKGVYNASTLSKRHKEWGEFWAARNYAALLVDSFGPRGYPEGFPRGSYADRPPEVSEQTVRPLDAYGALRYLRKHTNIVGDQIGLQGWSNGAMTTLVTMSDQAPGRLADQPGFRAAVAEYPGCGMDAVKGEYRNYAPILLMMGDADEEVSPKICEAFAKRARIHGDDLEFHLFPGAEHNYDDPSKTKQSNQADHAATVETFRRAEAFFTEKLRR